MVSTTSTAHTKSNGLNIEGARLGVVSTALDSTEVVRFFIAITKSSTAGAAVDINNIISALPRTSHEMAIAINTTNALFVKL